MTHFERTNVLQPPAPQHLLMQHSQPSTYCRTTTHLFMVTRWAVVLGMFIYLSRTAKMYDPGLTTPALTTAGPNKGLFKSLFQKKPDAAAPSIAQRNELCAFGHSSPFALLLKLVRERSARACNTCDVFREGSRAAAGHAQKEQRCSLHCGAATIRAPHHV